MITRPFLFMVVCLGFIFLIQSLFPKVMAMKKPNIDEFTLEDRMTRKRKNYVLQLARDRDLLGNIDNMGVSYGTDLYKSKTNPEELSALMVDYANMIRNDVILLDNSVETRTRKRGNYKVKKYNNHVISDPPCSCEYSTDKKDFGEHSYPRWVEIRNCSKEVQRACVAPYVCRENYYNITILRRKEYQSQPSLDLPNEFKFKWIAEEFPISVGCVCTNEYFVK